MGFSAEFIQDLKSRIDAIELIGSYVTLQRAGSRLRGLCPFHQEKTASFYVSEDTGLYHCFGCHAAGDVIRFVEQIEGLDFSQAVRFLAERYNIPLQFESGSVEDYSKRDRLYDVLNQANEFYRNRLKESPEARSYLLGRGFSDETIHTLQIGYAPDDADFTRQLMSRDVDRKTLEDAGLINDKGQDKFRGRIMFPIHDLYGKTVGFGGRILDPESRAPKYLNSPATPVFEKKRMLYGLNLTRDYIRKTGYVILVEGYMDFAALFQHGIVNVAAALGTSFTEQHAVLLKRFARKVYLCFDADEAGMTAALRSFHILAPGGLFVHGVTLPRGEDPDSYVQEQGKEKFMMLLDQSMEIPMFLAEERLKREEISRLPLDEKLQRVETILSAIAAIPDRIRQSYYIRDLSSRLGIPERNIAAQLKRGGRSSESSKTEPVKTPLDHLREPEKTLLLLAATNPEFRKQLDVNADWLKGLDVQAYLKEVQGVQFSKLGDVLHLLSEPLRTFLTMRSDPVSVDPDALIHRLKQLSLKRRIDEIGQELKRFQEGMTDEEKNGLLRKKEQLVKQYHALKR